MGAFAGQGGRGIDVDAVGVEVQAGDLGAVPAVQLIPRPGFVNELLIEDAVVHE